MSFQPIALPSPSGGGSRPPAPVPRTATEALNKRAKAAIVVRFLLNQGAEIALEDLPEDLQEILTHQMGTMRLVDKGTVDQVIEEFAAELDGVGLSFPGSMAGALEALDGKISPHTASRLRRGDTETGLWAFRVAAEDAGNPFDLPLLRRRLWRPAAPRRARWAGCARRPRSPDANNCC